MNGLLAAYLGHRVEAARAVDGDFAAELCARMSAFTLAGGKGLRSVLAWWGWLAGGGTAAGPVAGSALRACSAVEVLQSFALAHDDVMDAAPLRRGSPSFHAVYTRQHRERGLRGDARRYGESLAILVGDLAMVWADDLLHESLADLPTGAAAHAVWRDMRTEVIAGQFLDLGAQADGDRSEDRAVRIDQLKTATYTVERPLHMGAVMAGADEATVTALRAYGTDVGVAFQLRNDLMDAYGAPDHTGKRTGEDLREGKNTLLLACGVRRAEEAGDRSAQRALARVGRSSAPEDAEEAARVLDRVGAREEVSRRCRLLAERGLGRIRRLDLHPAVSEGLRRFAETAART
ncbi:polyprenyl synthetase family protein [Nocardiopsis eucommiae]|uniref:Polyprenyl synthetase family protein n=1 Tax=Nocardiopsis eucommiae TaxID=2831970 RepID=A0A975QM33_9ACTN|nr:polyprenyl synthetase family protein [Nocardiopsis eucommiae]